MLKDQIQADLKKHLQSLGFDDPQAEIVASSGNTHGDYATSVAMQLAKQVGKAPMEIAQRIVQSFDNDKPEYIEKIQAVVPGFVNFTISAKYLAQELQRVLNEKKAIVEPRVGSGQTVIIEFSSPNIAKPMGVGHLRSTIIGQSLVNMYQSLGYNVIAINYLGDWGTQFGNLIAAYKRWHDDKAFAQNPIGHLLELYIKFTNEAKDNPDLAQEGRDEFTKLEQGDAENLALWQQFREVSLQEFEAIYKRLGITFTVKSGESEFRNKTDHVYKLLEQKGLVTSEGQALILDLTTDDASSTLVRKSDGSSVYLTRDIANIEFREDKWHPSQIIYVVGQDQSLHFKQLFLVSQKLGIVGDTQLSHVGFGLVLLEGKRMRTREGKTIFLDELLDEAVSKARKVVAKKSKALSDNERERIAEVVGVGSVKYNDLSQNRLTTIDFNWDKMLASEGNSAPYLLYTLARAHSVLEQAHDSDCQLHADVLAQIETELLKLLSRYTEAVHEAAGQYAPNIIANYLFELAQKFNTFYATSPILKAENTVRQTRLGLTLATSLILEDGLALLGIEAVRKM